MPSSLASKCPPCPVAGHLAPLPRSHLFPALCHCLTHSPLPSSARVKNDFKPSEKPHSGQDLAAPAASSPVPFDPGAGLALPMLWSSTKTPKQISCFSQNHLKISLLGCAGRGDTRSKDSRGGLIPAHGWSLCLSVPGYEPLAPLPPAASAVPVWQDRTIASTKLRLLEYSAFMEVPRDAETVTASSSCSGVHPYCA